MMLRVYVLGLLVVAAIVNWLVDVMASAVIGRFIVPSLQRARRERAVGIDGREYRRGIAAAACVRYALDAAAVFAACWYYAQSNAPAWPAWALFGLFALAFHLPRFLGAATRLARASA